MSHLQRLSELAKLDSESLIVQSNDIVYGVMDYSIDEFRIVTYLQSFIGRHDTDFNTHEIKVSDIAKKAGLSSGNHLYEKIETVSSLLMKKVITVRDGKSFKMRHLMDTIDYDHSRGVLTLRFHDDMKPYFLGLEGDFTKAERENLLRFSNTKPVKLFVILKSHLWAREKRPLKIAVSYIRQLMKLEESYKNFNMFRERVIFFSQKKIEEHSDIFFELSEESNGKTRAITDLIFEIHLQHPQWKFSHKTIEVDNVVQFETISDASAYLSVYGLDDEQIQDVIKKYELGYIAEKVNYINYRTFELTEQIHCGAYFLRSLENDYKLKSVEFVLSDGTGEDKEVESGDIFALLIAHGIGRTVAKRFVKQYAPSYLQEKVDYLLKEVQRVNIDKTGAWLRKAIEDDYKDSKSATKIANEKAAQKRADNAKKKQEEEKKEEKQSTGYYEAIKIAIAEKVTDEDRDNYLAELIDDDKSVVFRALVKNGKTSYDDVLSYPVAKGFVLGLMATIFLSEEYQSLDTWEEHIGASTDSPPLSDD